MMKMWKWETFVISLLVSFLISMMIVVGAERSNFSVWPLIFVLALVLAAGFTFIKGLLKRLSDTEYRLSLLEHRVRELEKKTEDN